MRSFFYFVPNQQTLTPEGAVKLGLAYAFERGIDCTQVQNGPGGQAGIVCVQQDSYDLGKNGYHEKQQVWRQIPKSEIWVGHYKDELPGPEDLVRKKCLTGRQIELDDGNLWMIPLARSYNERITGSELEIFMLVQLPQRLDLGADGRWVIGGVNARYATLWELNEAWLRVRDSTASEEERRRFDYQGQTDAAVIVLQANYRIGRVEAAMLGILSDELAIEVLDTLIDIVTFIALIKKKETLKSRAPSTSPAGISSADGLEASIPTTDRQALT